MISSAGALRPLLLAALLLGVELPAQDLPPPPQPPATAQPESPLDTLTGPIALYPDPLVALILPASTAPADISAAAAYQVQYGDTTQLDRQPWDPSVRALAHYPAVVSWLAANLPWTRALGAAFLASPSDVMASIQGLRARALASGALASGPEQQVVSEGGFIEILPAHSGVISVPLYDPGVAYSADPYASGDVPVGYGPACPAGDWLSFGIDWSRQTLWNMGPGAWHNSDGWHRPSFGGDRAPKGARPWNPPDSSRRPPVLGQAGGTPPRPAPMPGTRPAPSVPRPTGPGEPGSRRNEPATGPDGRAPHGATAVDSGSNGGPVVPGVAPQTGVPNRTSLPPASSHSEPGRSPAPEPARSAPPSPSDTRDPKTDK